MTFYRLSWEVVSAISHPQAYDPRTDRASMPVDIVPEAWWSRSHRDTDNPWDQLRGLKELKGEGELIRNIRLHKLSKVEVTLGELVEETP